jgi:hypothetical protein
VSNKLSPLKGCVTLRDDKLGSVLLWIIIEQDEPPSRTKAAELVVDTELGTVPGIWTRQDEKQSR